MSLTAQLRFEIESALIEAVETECYGDYYEAICEGVSEALNVSILTVEMIYDELFEQPLCDEYDCMTEGYDE